MSSIPSRHQFQTFFKPEPTNFTQQTALRGPRSSSIYNLKDFLPQTSNISIQSRQKTKSTIMPQSSFINRSGVLSSSNVQEKLIQQKMNLLKQSNAELMQTIEQQKKLIRSHEEQMQGLRNQIKKMKSAEQNKLKRLTLWSYKFHVEHTPKQKHKYCLAVQTDDIYSSKGLASGQGSFRAKDFQQIYRKLNTNPSSIKIGTHKLRKQLGNMKVSSNITFQNPSILQNNSTLKVIKGLQQNKSHFQPEKQEQVNKENIMNWSNMNFQSNPMSLNLTRIQEEQKPIKQQCLEIYSIQQDYLEAIIGEILCGQQV